MATHSSILAWRIPWTEEPGGLQSMGLQRVRYDSATHTFTFKPVCWKCFVVVFFSSLFSLIGICLKKNNLFILFLIAFFVLCYPLGNR